MSDEAKSEAPLTREFLFDHAERLDPGIRQHYGDEWAEAFARNSLEAERVREQIALTALQQQELERSNLRWQQRSAWAPVLRGGDGEMRIIGYGGGGGGAGGNAHHAVATGTNGRGGAGGQVYASVKALVDAGRASSAESMRELQSQGYAWEPAPSPPERQYCACGQELRTPRAQGRRICGDCFSQCRAGTRMSDVRPLDARIAAAKSSDPDPTSEWGAGATPGYDWEGR